MLETKQLRRRQNWVRPPSYSYLSFLQPTSQYAPLSVSLRILAAKTHCILQCISEQGREDGSKSISPFLVTGHKGIGRGPSETRITPFRRLPSASNQSRSKIQHDFSKQASGCYHDGERLASSDEWCDRWSTINTTSTIDTTTNTTNAISSS